MKDVSRRFKQESKGETIILVFQDVIFISNVLFL